jgi:hypothetical protein
MLFALGLLLDSNFAQESRSQFMKEGLVKRNGSSATVIANDPRPLAQAISALNEEYGWVVDYEDPPYSSNSELIDATNPKWRAEHPGAPGVKGIAGGAFQSDYEESPQLNTAAGEEAFLQKIVSDYDLSGNPGRFLVRDEGEVTLSPAMPGSKVSVIHRFSIIGKSIKDSHGQDYLVSSILDTPISIPVEQRSAQATIDEIARGLSAQTGTRVFGGAVANNLLLQSQVTVGGENVSARSLLTKTLNDTQRPQIWRLLYDPGAHIWVLNISLANRAVRDSDGTRRVLPIDSPPLRRPNRSL